MGIRQQRVKYFDIECDGCDLKFYCQGGIYNAVVRRAEDLGFKLFKYLGREFLLCSKCYEKETGKK